MERKSSYKYKLPNLTYGATENLKRSVTRVEVTRFIMIRKTQHHMALLMNSTDTEDFKLMALKLFQKTEEKGTLFNKFYKASITWHQTQTKISQGNDRTLMSTDVKTQQNISKLKPATYWKDSTPCSNEIYPRKVRIVLSMKIYQYYTLH